MKHGIPDHVVKAAREALAAARKDDPNMDRDEEMAVSIRAADEVRGLRAKVEVFPLGAVFEADRVVNVTGSTDVSP
jgi:hypothetical protein